MRWPRREPRFTAGQADAAVANAEDLVVDGLGLAERDRDLIFLVRAAAREMRADPDVTLDQVMERAYQVPAREARSWWSDWE